LEQIRHVGIAKSEHPRLTNGEINFKEFQPMWSQSTNVTDRQTDGQTDDMQSQYRALHQSETRGEKRDGGQAEAKTYRPRSMPRPKFWSLFGLEDLTSLTTTKCCTTVRQRDITSYITTLSYYGI